MSSWIDKIAVETTLQLKTEFNSNVFIETGTFRGVCAELYSHYFELVLTCENNKEYFDIARKRLSKYENVITVCDDSALFLKNVDELYRQSDDAPFVTFFLDAHDNTTKWTVVNELKSLINFHNCMIIIHDFDCSGLGHLVRDGESLNWNSIKDEITKVNPNFHYYCNTKEYCDIHTLETAKNIPIELDDFAIDMVNHANSMGDKKNRGILYALPKSIDITKYKLIEFKHE